MEILIKSITNFLIIVFIFQQLKSQKSQIDQNGYNTFCDETLPKSIVFNEIMHVSKDGKEQHGNNFPFPFTQVVLHGCTHLTRSIWHAIIILRLKS